MKKFLLSLLVLIPLAAQAQLTAPTADVTIPTTNLTGPAEYIYVFFDDHPIALTAAAADTSAFTWTTLNVPAVRLDTLQRDDSATVASLQNIPEGGYQLTVRNLVDSTAAIDTFTTWIFRDTFQVTGITFLQSCDELELTMHSGPSLYRLPVL